MPAPGSHTRNGRLGEGVSIVVPTYREAENLPALVGRIGAVMAPLSCPYEIVIVDDDSKDGTDRVVADLAAAGRPVRLITRVGERGLSSAVLRGFREARGDILVCMDADLSHPPEAIPRLLACLADPAVDFVLASRYVAGGSTDERWGLLRWINSKVAALLARPFVSVRDPMSGFFALRRSVLSRAAELSPVGYKIGLELMVKCGCRCIREVPIHFALRRGGRSKLTFAEQINYLRHIRRLAVYKLRAGRTLSEPRGR
jgi:dolichol-phosphate mannosyltransferase